MNDYVTETEKNNSTNIKKGIIQTTTAIGTTIESLNLSEYDDRQQQHFTLDDNLSIMLNTNHKPISGSNSSSSSSSSSSCSSTTSNSDQQLFINHNHNNSNKNNNIIKQNNSSNCCLFSNFDLMIDKYNSNNNNAGKYF